MVNLRSLRGMRRIIKQNVDNDATRATSSDVAGTYVSSAAHVSSAYLGVTYVSSAYGDVTFVKSS